MATLQASKCPTCGSDVQTFDSLGMRTYIPRRSYATIEIVAWTAVAAESITMGKACEMLDVDREEGERRYGEWLQGDLARSLPDYPAIKAREEEYGRGVPAEIPDDLLGS